MMNVRLSSKEKVSFSSALLSRALMWDSQWAWLVWNCKNGKASDILCRRECRELCFISPVVCSKSSRLASRGRKHSFNPRQLPLRARGCCKYTSVYSNVARRKRCCQSIKASLIPKINTLCQSETLLFSFIKLLMGNIIDFGEMTVQTVPLPPTILQGRTAAPDGSRTERRQTLHWCSALLISTRKTMQLGTKVCVLSAWWIILFMR